MAMNHSFAALLAQASGNEDVAFEWLKWLDGRAEFLIFVAAFALVFAAIGIVMLIALWRVFTKAGQPGWAVLVPVYNLVVLLRIAGLPWYWVFTPLVIIIPILGILAYLAWVVWVHHRISTRFGQGVGFTVGLTLLPPIFWLILAFGSAQYDGEQPAQA